MHYALTLWLISVLTVMSPPERDAKLARGTETAAQRAQRYEGIAYDIATAAEGHALPGMNERQTAALLTSIAFYESSFAPNVDDGTCNENVTYDPEKLCDGGSSVGLMQIHFGKGQTAFMGKTMEELLGVSNRVTNLQTGLAAIRAGITVCTREWKYENPGWKIQPGLDLDLTPYVTHADGTIERRANTGMIIQQGLGWYARGSCKSPSGLKDGEKKMKLMNRVLKDKRFPRFDPSVTQPKGEVD